MITYLHCQDEEWTHEFHQHGGWTSLWFLVDIQEAHSVEVASHHKDLVNIISGRLYNLKSTMNIFHIIEKMVEMNLVFNSIW